MDRGRPDDVLAGALERWQRSAEPEDNDSYDRWSTPGGYWVYGGSLGKTAGVEFVLWVATAVASGVLGNAAYDALKQVVARVGARPAGDPVLADDDVVLIARLAVRVLRVESGMDATGTVEVASLAWRRETGRWETVVRDRHGSVRCSVADADPADVLVYGVAL